MSFQKTAHHLLPKRKPQFRTQNEKNSQNWAYPHPFLSYLLEVDNNRYMTSREGLLAYLQKRKWRVFFLFGGLCVVIGTLFQLLTPKQRIIKVPSPSFLNQESQVRTVLEGDVSFPSPQFSLYTADSHTTLQAFFQQIATHLHLSPSSYSTSVYYDANKSSSLSYESTQGYIYYSNSKVSSQSIEPNLDEGKARGLGEEFLTSLGLQSTDFIIDQTSIKHYISNQGELETSDTGPTVELHFTRILNALPVTTGGSTLNYIEVFVNSAGVFKARFPTLIFSLTQQNSVPHLSLDQIKQNIEAGTYKILGTPIDTQTNGPVFGSFTSFVLHLKSFEYRLDEQSGVFIPFAHFEGSGTPTSTPRAARLELITPAISTQ